MFHNSNVKTKLDELMINRKIRNICERQCQNRQYTAGSQFGRCTYIMSAAGLNIKLYAPLFPLSGRVVKQRNLEQNVKDFTHQIDTKQKH